MPPTVKSWMTDGYMALRRYRESRAVRGEKPEKRAGLMPRVVYMTGFPRSGTTMLKYYFGSHTGLRQTEFNPVGFFRAWEMSQDGGEEILVDKSNHYIGALPKIFGAYGRAVRVCLIVRDPRDVIASITKYSENREVPRDRRYWTYWAKQHARLIEFMRHDEFADGLYLVRYEDLVRFPVDAKTAFLSWLGIEVDEAEIDNVYTNQNPGEGWDDSVHHRREVTDYSLQKWRQMKKPPGWARRLVDEWRQDPGAEEAMRLLGYDEGGFTAPVFDGGKATLYRPGES